MPSSDPYLNDDDGTPLYAVSTSSFGSKYHKLVRAKNLKEAKGKYGWTRQLHTFIRVRRARESDSHLPRSAQR